MAVSHAFGRPSILAVLRLSARPGPRLRHVDSDEACGLNFVPSMDDPQSCFFESIHLHSRLDLPAPPVKPSRIRKHEPAPGILSPLPESDIASTNLGATCV